ncbi:MAG: beta-mannanase, partial [Clostridia bacterium]|nr:beta-mannanase [Clostridia bacterium]
MDFIIGCNYWASNAGADMWRKFDLDIIDKDLKILSENGVKCLRAFPNWRDFQPVIPIVGALGKITGYSFENGKKPDDEFYIDKQMTDRFSQFLDVCEKYDLDVIVGLVTGWMSGGLFVPPALYGKNVITDPLALYFQQLFIKVFVSEFKDRKAISA